MRRSRLIAALLALSLITACFMSVPVFAEHPWDADLSNGSKGGDGQTNSDSTSNDESNDGTDPLGESDAIQPTIGDVYDWLFWWSFDVTYSVLRSVHAPDADDSMS